MFLNPHKYFVCEFFRLRSWESQKYLFHFKITVLRASSSHQTFLCSCTYHMKPSHDSTRFAFPIWKFKRGEVRQQLSPLDRLENKSCRMSLFDSPLSTHRECLMVLIEKGRNIANGARIVTDPEVARRLPGPILVRDIQIVKLFRQFKTQLDDRCWLTLL